jgi:hypothetical protein
MVWRVPVPAAELLRRLLEPAAGVGANSMIATALAPSWCNRNKSESKPRPWKS